MEKVKTHVDRNGPEDFIKPEGLFFHQVARCLARAALFCGFAARFCACAQRLTWVVAVCRLS
jgi:hypothetical protein